MRCKYLMVVAIVAVTAFVYSPTPGYASLLGLADSFAVLGNETVTNTGSSNVTGDLGVYDGPSVVGFQIPPANTVVEGPGSTGLINGPGLVSGTIHISDAIAGQAQIDATNAYTGLASTPFISNLSGQDLGGLTLTSGVYNFSSSAQLTGPLTLNAQGLDNALWIFQIGSDLTTASSSSVVLANPGLNSGIFWQVGSSATLGTSTSFLGNILADQSITLNTNANILCGRALALNGAVTMDTNDINAVCEAGGLSGGLVFDGNGNVNVVPEPATLALLGLGLLGGLRFKKK